MSVIIVVFQLIAQVCECCDNARWNKRTSLRVKTCVQAFEKTLVRMRDSGTWEKHQDALSTLREVLSEAETVLTRITGRSSMSRSSLDPQDKTSMLWTQPLASTGR